MQVIIAQQRWSSLLIFWTRYEPDEFHQYTHVQSFPPLRLQAEILANRIAVVASGQVVACGSALELKREYGGEHRLTATVAETSAEDESRADALSLLELVHRNAPDATLATDEGHAAVGGSRSTDEVIVRLPLESDAHNRDDVLAKIFTDIDLARSEGDFCTLSNIGLEMPSLEAAFVRLLRAAENQPSGGNEDLQSTQQDASLPDEDEDDQESVLIRGDSHDETKITLLQTLALLRKEVWLLRADWTSALTMLLFEPIYIIVILFLSDASVSDDVAPVFVCDPKLLACYHVLASWPGSRADNPACARALMQELAPKENTSLLHWTGRSADDMREYLTTRANRSAAGFVIADNAADHCQPGHFILGLFNGSQTRALPALACAFSHAELGGALAPVVSVSPFIQTGTAEGSMIVLLVGLGHALLPAALLHELIAERTAGLSVLLRLSGLRPCAQWMSFIVSGTIKAGAPSFLTISLLAYLRNELLPVRTLPVLCLCAVSAAVHSALLMAALGARFVKQASHVGYASTALLWGSYLAYVLIWAILPELDSGRGSTFQFSRRSADGNPLGVARVLVPVLSAISPSVSMMAAIASAIAVSSARVDQQHATRYMSWDIACNEYDKDQRCLGFLPALLGAWLGCVACVAVLVRAETRGDGAAFALDDDDNSCLRSDNDVEDELDADTAGSASDEAARTEAARVSAGLRGGEGSLLAFACDLRKTYRVTNASRDESQRGQCCGARTRHVAVRGLSLGVDQGEVLAILGPNGAGKTSFVRCLSGTSRPTSGVVRIVGHPTPAAHAKGIVGLAPQQDGLWTHLSPEQHLALHWALFVEPRASAQSARAAANRTLQKFNLLEHAHKLTSRCSGGTCQRLKIALALLSRRRRIVFLDEPSCGVDITNRRILWNAITRAARRGEEALGGGAAVVMATHALEEAEAISTRVGMIGAGRLRAIGPPRTLCQAHGRGTHRLEIRCSANADERARQWVLSTFPSQELEQHGTVLRFEMTIGNMGLGSALSALASVCAEADSPILDFAVTRTSLEQIYLAISTEASALSQQAP